jgi:hypothetical protein
LSTSFALALLDQAYDHKAWHGTNLKGSIRGLDARVVIWRPAPHRHNIAELVIHAAYWKYAVWRLITGAEKGSFPLEGSNWFARPASPSSAATEWKADRIVLNEMHALLRGAVKELNERDFSRKPRGSKYTIRALVMGAASHDIYHAGQIQLIKRLSGG